MARHPTLFQAPTPGPGPIYQGVCKQIRGMLRDGAIDRESHAGTIAQARSLAASLDRVSGHTGAQASGLQLAALHAQLAALLATLAGSTTSDPFTDFLATLNDDTQAPHPPV